MELLLHLVELAGLGYLAWRVSTPPKPSIWERPAPSPEHVAIARAIVQHRMGSGRARLRQRLAEKAAKRAAAQ